MRTRKVILTVSLSLVVLCACVQAQDYGDVYSRFNRFCIANFGAEKETLVYETFGKKLKFIDSGNWLHASAKSEAVGFETNLPTKAYVEYGETAEYGERTSPHERHFYLHLHYLRNLKPDTTYHYRLVAVDERGNKLTSKDATFTTRTPENVIRVPEDMQGPPYVLDKAGATYLVTRDLTIDGMAFDVKAPNVTLDLGGHTVVYDNKHWGKLTGSFWAYINDSKFGVRATKISGLKVLNGTVRQGTGNDGATPGLGYNPMYFRGCSKAEVAGVTVVYSGAQQIGIYNHWAGKGGEFHHNVFVDAASKVLNRHGSGSRAIIAGGGQPGIHHNLVKRTRQSGFAGGTKTYGNRVFGGGYHIFAIGWGNGIRVFNNFVHLKAQKLPDVRSKEFGKAASLNGIRLTQYGGSNKPYHSNLYYGNVVIIKAKDGRQARGVQFASHKNVKNLVCRDSVIKVEALDDETENVACIVAHGYRTDSSLPLYYRNCTLISNVCNVRFGDDYSRGSNHRIQNCKFVRTGNNPNYHTFIFDGGWWTRNHVILDCEFGEGTKYDDVYWRRVSAECNYSVAWTLEVETVPDAKVVIRNSKGEEEFSGTADAEGKISAPLKQCIIRPKEWKPNVEKQAPLRLKLEHQEETLTPHTVIVQKDGRTARKTVIMTRKQQIRIEP